MKIAVTLFIFGFISTSFANNDLDGDTNKLEISSTYQENTRNKKLLSLFSIVTFPNQGCASMDASRNGTCYTSTECQNKDGIKSGNCAAGFGVCCLFIVSATSDTIDQNCTYIQNPSFPSVYSSQTALSYVINKCSSDVCAVRLDFETFATVGPIADTAEAMGGVCTDSFVVSGTTTGTTGATPNICGLNTGQHIYVEMGNSGSTDTATLAFAFAGASTARTWEIKATQVPCGASWRQPEGCLQYHTTLTGRFQTFNFADATTPIHLASQNYGICIRQEEGYCCIEYALCADAYSWSLAMTVAIATTDLLCTKDYVGIAGATNNCQAGGGSLLHNSFCGVVFGTVEAMTAVAPPATRICDCSAPFIVQIFTDAIAGIAPTAAAPARGLCLEYKQKPC